MLNRFKNNGKVVKLLDPSEICGYEELCIADMDFYLDRVIVYG